MFARLRQRLSAKIIIESLKVTLVSFATLLLAIPRVPRNIISRDRGWNFFFSRMKDVRNHRNILTLVSGYDLLPYRRQ